MDRGGRGGIPAEPSFGARRHIRQLVEESWRLRKPIALDSSALIPYFDGTLPPVRLLEPLFGSRAHGVVISFVSVAETLVRPALAADNATIAAMRDAILGLPGLIAIPLDAGSMVQTTVMRNRTGLRLPDAAIIAAAHIGGAHALIGNDRVWKNRDLGLPYHHLDDILAME